MSMAKKDLRAQMDAARAAAAFIGAAQEEVESAPEEEILSPAKETSSKATRAKTAKAAEAARAAEAQPETVGEASFSTQSNLAVESAEASVDGPPLRPKASRTRKHRKKNVEAAPVEEAVEGSGARMTAQVLVPMTAEQREHADLLASVMKVTRAEVMRQALDEYWESHKAELQAAVAAYEELIKKLMK